MKLSAIHLALLSLIPSQISAKGIRTATLKRESCLGGATYDSLIVDLENEGLIEDIHPFIEGGDQIHAWRCTAAGDKLLTPKVTTAAVAQPSLTRDLFAEVLQHRENAYQGTWPTWTVKDREAAQLEGWDLFQTERGKFDQFDIQALDEPIEGGVELKGRNADNEAWAIVLKGALAGNPLHLKVLVFLLHESPIELWRILSDGFDSKLPIDEPDVCIYVGAQLRLAVSFSVAENLAVASDQNVLRGVIADAIEERILAAGGLRRWLLDEQLDNLDCITIDEVGSP